MKWIRHYADVVPSKGIVRVMQQLYESNNPKGLHRKKKLKVSCIEEVKMQTVIPMEEIEVSISHFDSTAWNNDDREFCTTKKVKRYNPELMRIEGAKALAGYNTEPIQIL